MSRLLRGAGIAMLALAGWLGSQDRHGPPLPRRDAPLAPALLLLRQGKTIEARNELNRLLKERPEDAEIHYQLARSHLLDFHRSAGTSPAKARVSLSLAMEALGSALRRDANHIPALKAKSVIHARAELLYYDPNLAFELSKRVAVLEPHANEYLLKVAEWMAGEVRFTEHSDHRVPHDPQVGLDRSLDLLERVLDSAMPFSEDESAALFLMGNTLARRGNFAESLEYYRQALARPVSVNQRLATLRELGAAQYRLGDFNEAARQFFQALQLRPGAVDQWLLKVALDRIKDKPPLPESVLFRVAEPEIDPSNPPMLEFDDIAPQLGLNRFDGNGTVAWGDVDGDGDQDVFLSGSGAFLAFYLNEGAKFRDATAEAGLANVPSGYSLNVIDYDNDGRLDLYLSLNGWSGPMRNRLFRNAGAGRFRDVSKESGADDPGSGFVSLWGDLDNDGDLDLVVANGVLKDGSVPQLYRNNGNGTFSNVTKEAGVDEPPTHGTIGAALGDYDLDGDLDILFNGLNNSPNRLYRNEGKWRFTEVAARSGVVQPPHNGFVCFFADFDNDGWPDILTFSLAPWEAVAEGLKKNFRVAGPNALHADSTRLFRNNRDGTFTDVTLAARLHAPMGVMGAGIADLDNDGYLDIYAGTGDPQLSRLEPNRFFRNRGDGVFSDLTFFLNLTRPGNKGHGVAFIDIDADGDLDMYAQLGGHYQGDHAENAFYRNLKGNRNHWLQVDLTGTKSNRFAIGAVLLARAGAMTIHREVKGSEGFGATNPYRVHFGLGKNAKVDSLEVRWPSGIRQTFDSIPAGRVVEIREDAGLVR